MDAMSPLTEKEKILLARIRSRLAALTFGPRSDGRDADEARRARDDELHAFDRAMQLASLAPREVVGRTFVSMPNGGSNRGGGVAGEGGAR